MDIPRKNAKRHRRIRQGIYTVIGLAVVAALTMGLSRLQPAAPGVDRRTLWIDTVKRGSMLRQVRGVGSLLSEDVLLVPAGVSGRVIRILVEPGTMVEADTVILELINPELQLELRNAESQLSSARAQLTAQKVSLEDQLLGQEASLAQLEANYREAELKAEVDQKQFDDDLISELNLTLSKARVENLKNLVAVNKKRLAMFRDQTIPAQLSELEAAIRQAESLHKLKQNQVDSLHVCTGKPGVLAQVKNQIEPGQQVTQGTILAKITNPKRLKARLKIPEVQARDVRLGLKAELETRVSLSVVAGSEQSIQADHDQLEQLLINIVTNAVEACLETHTPEQAQVSMRWQTSHHGLQIWVEDDGPGLTPDNDVFVPFFTTKPQGSGIGLALSLQIAEAHGGLLTLENRTDGSGCRACLSLPC